MAKYPADRFDVIPSDLTRTGAHRGPRLKGRGWIAFAWAALATGLLVGAGVIGLAVIDKNIQFPGLPGDSSPSSVAPPTTTSTPTVEPVTDPDASVTILNGTETVGLAASVGEAMREAGWAKLGAMSNASATDFQTTTVYYADAKYEAAARGLADALFGKASADAEANGVALSITAVRIELSDQFQGADLTAVLGADFLGPITDAPTGEPAQ